MGPVLHWLAGAVVAEGEAVYISDVKWVVTNGRVNQAYNGHRSSDCVLGASSRKNGEHQKDEYDSGGKTSKHIDGGSSKSFGLRVWLVRDIRPAALYVEWPVKFVPFCFPKVKKNISMKRSAIDFQK